MADHRNPGTSMAGDPVESLNPIDRMRLFYRLMRDDRVGTWAKALVPTVTAIYVISPIDLVPDFILGVGQLDDLGVLGLAIIIATRLLPKLSPNQVVSEHLGAMGVGGRGRAGGNSARSGKPGTPASEEFIDAEFRVEKHQ